jgi:hypothetical protein
MPLRNVVVTGVGRPLAIPELSVLAFLLLEHLALASFDKVFPHGAWSFSG